MNLRLTLLFVVVGSCLASGVYAESWKNKLSAAEARLAKGNPGIRFDYLVVNKEEDMYLGASASSDQKIHVYEGDELLKIIENAAGADGLAWIVAHEVGHLNTMNRKDWDSADSAWPNKLIIDAKSGYQTCCVLKQGDNDQYFLFEALADATAHFYGHLAGIDTVGAVQKLIASTKARRKLEALSLGGFGDDAYQIAQDGARDPKSQLPKCKDLNWGCRVRIAGHGLEWVEKCLQVYDAGGMLLASGHQEQARYCFEWLKKYWVPLPEVEQALGLCDLSKAFQQWGRWPLPIKIEQRLHGRKGPQRETGEVVPLARAALGHFLAAEEMQPGYYEAEVYKIYAHVLLKAVGAGPNVLASSKSIAELSKSPLARGDGRIPYLSGLLLATDGKSEEAKVELSQAQAEYPVEVSAALNNLTLLNITGAPESSPAVVDSRALAKLSSILFKAVKTPLISLEGLSISSPSERKWGIRFKSHGFIWDVVSDQNPLAQFKNAKDVDREAGVKGNIIRGTSFDYMVYRIADGDMLLYFNESGSVGYGVVRCIADGAED